MIDDKKMDGLFKYNNLSSKLCSKLTARSSSICRKSKNYKDKVELINDESFNISYSMQALENQYEWEIDYRINKTENDKELKLKFSFEGNQPIEIEENESWTLKEKIQ